MKDKEKKDVILTPISNEEIAKEKEQQKEELAKVFLKYFDVY